MRSRAREDEPGRAVIQRGSGRHAGRPCAHCTWTAGASSESLRSLPRSSADTKGAALWPPPLVHLSLAMTHGVYVYWSPPHTPSDGAYCFTTAPFISRISICAAGKLTPPASTVVGWPSAAGSEVAVPTRSL